MPLPFEPSEDPSNNAVSLLDLPVEIIIEIFTRCLPQTIKLMDPLRAPRLLMHVCRGWRHIAVSVPTLWNDFCIGLNEPIREEELMACLERSANLPLSVSIFCEEGDWEIQNKEHLHLLSRYCHRIKRLRFDMFMEDIQRVDELWLEMYPGAELPWPALERLELMDPRKSSFAQEQDSWSVGMFASAPHIQSIDLHVPANLVSTVVFPQNNMVEFKGRADSVQIWGDILSSMPLLKHCTMYLDGQALELAIEQPLAPLHHPTLESLNIDVLGLGETILSDWTLTGPHPIYHLWAVAESSIILAFNVESFPRLSMLSAIVATVTEGRTYESIRTACAPLSFLHTIIFQHATPEFMEDFFELFGSNNTFLPNLQHMRFVHIPLHSLPDLINWAGSGIVRRRALETPNSSLKNLEIGGFASPMPVPPGIMEAMLVKYLDRILDVHLNVLSGLKRDGLDVAIYWYSPGRQQIHELPL
ncbi:hypothetical protein C8F01DRAFT_1018265 [Mycena amicta]|nr:hypothetical protein C8F01DRAFT_1018265 [Mycena amicta]